jgi:hypothetical protein
MYGVSPLLEATLSEAIVREFTRPALTHAPEGKSSKTQTNNLPLPAVTPSPIPLHQRLPSLNSPLISASIPPSKSRLGGTKTR